MKKTRLDKYGNISTLLSGKGKHTNLTILEILVLQGYRTIWDLTKAEFRTRNHREPSRKEIRSHYSTIYRALMRFLEYEYITECGTVRHSTHKKEHLLPLYGLTTKGLMVTMVISEKVRQNWQAWVKNVMKEKDLPSDFMKIASLFLEYDASQRLFLKFFVNPNEKLVTSMYNMDTISAKTFWEMCLEKMRLTFEEGKYNPSKNLSQKDRNILNKIHQDSNIRRIRKHYLGFLEQQYSKKLKKVKSLRKSVPN